MLATERDGFITDGADRGLFVHETRLLSRYRYLIDGTPLQPVSLSNFEQHTWLGYYITAAPGTDTIEPATGSGLVDPATEKTLELCLSRYVGEGVHEDVDLTNFSQSDISFSLELEVDADQPVTRHLIPLKKGRKGLF